MESARGLALLLATAIMLAFPAAAQKTLTAGQGFGRASLPAPPPVSPGGAGVRQSRFSLENLSGHDEFVVSAHVGADTSLELFEVDDQRVESMAVFSRRLPALRGAAAEGPFTLRTRIPAGSTRSYLAVATGSGPCDLSIWSSRSFDDYAARRHLLLGLFYGAAILSAAIQLAFSLSLHDRSFLWYGLFVLLSSLSLSVWDGSAMEVLGVGTAFGSRLSYYALAVLSALAGHLFLREIFSLRSSFPRLDRGILVLAGANTLLAAIGLIGAPPFYPALVAVAGGLNATVLAGACLFAVLQGRSSTALVVAGLALQSSTSLLLILRAAAITPPRAGDLAALLFYPPLLASVASVSAFQIRRIRAIGAAREAAESRSKAIGDYLGDLSHELRTPVRLLEACAAELGRRGRPSRELVALGRNIERLSRTIDLLLVPPGGESPPRLPGTGASHDLAATVRARVEAFSPAATEAGIEFELELEPDLFVLAEAATLERIVDGLIEEAFHLGPWGGRARISTKRHGTIADLVIELPEPVREKGEGLRLALRLVGGLGGAVEEAPLADGGISIGMGLPVAPALPSRPAPGTWGAPTRPASTHAAEAGFRRAGASRGGEEGSELLLVVEDPSTRERLLARLGPERRVRAIASPAAALEELSAMDSCLAIVADIGYENPDILSFIKLVRAGPRHGNLPFVTGIAGKDRKAREGLLSQAGVVVLASPLDGEEVAAALQGLSRALQGAGAEGEDDSRLRLERMLGGLSHAIKNPLSGITGPLANLRRVLQREAPDRDAVERYLATMEESGERIKAILRDVGTVLRAQPLGIEAIRVGPILDRLAKRVEASRSGIEVIIGPGDQKAVGGDAAAAERLFENLLLNAVDAMEGSGRITVSFGESEGRLEVFVRDSGPGIPAGFLERVFEPFFTTKEGGEGMGLGLAIVRDLARRMGWEVEALARRESGAEFRVRAPIRDGETGAS